ncbi:MAG: (d)CMP kinase [Desulfovibrionales bacterium]
MSLCLVVTIDGPAGVGKTTIARRIAEYLSISYLDTGAMFRGVAWKLGPEAVDWSEDQLERALSELSFHLGAPENGSVLSLNGTPLPQAIRTEEIGFLASSLAKLPQVRKALKQKQRTLGENHSLVAEGRDMGTVVFPEARFKFFLDATVEERTKRRFLQLQQMGVDADKETLFNQIRLRDEQDRNREIAPLRPASDARIIDTTALDLKQVFKAVIREMEPGTEG